MVNYSGYNTSSHTFQAIYPTKTPEESDGSVLEMSTTNPPSDIRHLPDGGAELYSEVEWHQSFRRIFLTEVRDEAGNAITLKYDNQRRLISLIDAFGRSTTFSDNLANNPLLNIHYRSIPS